MKQPYDALKAKEYRRIHCSACPYFWTGLRACHCSSCHETFSGITSFDMHRDGNHISGTRHCVAPETLGLVLAEKNGWAAWSQPGTYDGPYEEGE